MTRVCACGKKVLEKRTKITYYCYHLNKNTLEQKSDKEDAEIPTITAKRGVKRAGRGPDLDAKEPAPVGRKSRKKATAQLASSVGLSTKGGSVARGRK